LNEADSPKLAAATGNAFGTIDDLDCKGRRVFLRVDPYILDTIDDARKQDVPSAEGDPALPAAPEASLRRALTSIEKLLELEARVIVGTHFTAEDRAATGLADVEELASRLSERLGVEALMPDECIGDASVRIIHGLRPQQICVLPDLLGSPGESKNDEGFARALAQHVDAYVGDAFASSHLPYASLSRLPRLVPRRALGYRARHELEVSSRLFASSRGSVALVLGGGTLGAKLGPVSGWLSRINKLYVGGAAAVTLLSAAGRAPALASTEPGRLAEARSLITRARDLGVEVVLPVDFWIQRPHSAEPEVVAARNLPEQARVVDIGPASTLSLSSALAQVAHLLWWGPLGDLGQHGVEGSLRVAELCAREDVMSVVMGQSTRRFVRELPPNVGSRIDLVTTGTQAVIALLGSSRLPGLEALRSR